MKKVFLLLAVCFTTLFFVASCSKGNNNKGGTGGGGVSEVSVTVDDATPIVGGYNIDKIELWPGRWLPYLRADVRDKNNNVIPDVPIGWTCNPPGLCVFKNYYTQAVTTFSVSGAPLGIIVDVSSPLPTGDRYIQAEYNGVIKKIPVIYDDEPLTVSFEMPSANVGGYLKLDGCYHFDDQVSGFVKAVVRRSNGTEDKNALIEWEVISYGDFGSGADPSKAYSTSGEPVWFQVTRSHIELLTNIEVEFTVNIRGVKYLSSACKCDCPHPSAPAGHLFRVYVAGGWSPAPGAPLKKGARVSKNKF